MAHAFEGKNILITGGVGTIGLALAKYLRGFNPGSIRLLDIDETRLAEVGNQLGDDPYRLFLGDVRDKDRLKRAMSEVDLVFHAAALKHVPICEYDPQEAVKTNILGTQNVIEAAIENNVEKVIYTSSDKAVNPYNVMGTSKLMAEKLITAANSYRGKHPTKFSSVRFGNVLASRGSILPIIESNIREGKNVEITHKDMTRFIMLEKEALELMVKAMDIMVGGEIFIFKMPVVRVPDLVEASVDVLAPLAGKRKENVKVIYSKPRIGEKLFEELMTESEAQFAKEDEKMFIILPHFSEAFISGKNFAKYDNLKNAAAKKYASNDEKPLSRSAIDAVLRKIYA